MMTFAACGRRRGAEQYGVSPPLAQGLLLFCFEQIWAFRWSFELHAHLRGEPHGEGHDVAVQVFAHADRRHPPHSKDGDGHPHQVTGGEADDVAWYLLGEHEVAPPCSHKEEDVEESLPIGATQQRQLLLQRHQDRPLIRRGQVADVARYLHLEGIRGYRVRDKSEH